MGLTRLSKAASDMLIDLYAYPGVGLSDMVAKTLGINSKQPPLGWSSLGAYLGVSQCAGLIQGSLRASSEASATGCHSLCLKRYSLGLSHADLLCSWPHCH